MYKPPPVAAVDKGSQHKNHEETNPVPGQEKTEVNLTIEYQFANPLYAALSSAAAPKVADKMIEAFENRVKAVLEGPAHARRK
jgi:coenzyme Q-binding protein COQ10